jgi:hypothetical protein
VKKPADLSDERSLPAFKSSAIPHQFHPVKILIISALSIIDLVCEP